MKWVKDQDCYEVESWVISQQKLRRVEAQVLCGRTKDITGGERTKTLCTFLRVVLPAHGSVVLQVGDGDWHHEHDLNPPPYILSR